MKNPFLAIGIFISGCFLLPISISMFTYSSIEEAEDIEEKSTKKNIINYETVDGEVPKIPVYDHKNKEIMNIDLEEYLYGVLSGEMPADFEMEALKAQAVAARTYVLYKEEGKSSSEHSDAVVCTDFNHCQEYKSYEELKTIKGEEWIEESYALIKKAIDDTKGHILTHDDKAILPLYFSTSSGKTENSSEVFVSQYPYLVSVESPYDNISPKYASTLKISNDDFLKTIKSYYPDTNLKSSNLKDNIKIEERSEGGSVKSIKIGNKTVKGSDVRSMFGLNSSNFEIKFEDGYIDFIVKGYGHGVGMSQWGANGMAQEGYQYYDILTHYYSDTEIKDIY